MTIRFAPLEEPKPLSLSERLGMDGHCIYINKHNFPILAEDNDSERIEVWVAVPARRAIIEDVPELKLTSKWVTA